MFQMKRVICRKCENLEGNLIYFIRWKRGLHFTASKKNVWIIWKIGNKLTLKGDITKNYKYKCNNNYQITTETDQEVMETTLSQV